MSDIAQIWKKEMDECVNGIERLIIAAAERAADLARDPLLNGRRQSVAGLRNHLQKLVEDVEALRREFRPASAEVEESVDGEPLQRLAEDAEALRREFRPALVEVEESVDTDLLEQVAAARNGGPVAVEADGFSKED